MARKKASSKARPKAKKKAAPSSVAVSRPPRSATVEKAIGGFVVSAYNHKTGRQVTEIATNMEAANKIVKRILKA